MWVGEAAHFSTQLHYLLIRKTSVKALLGVVTFPSHGCVGKFVTLKASNFNKTQQPSTNGMQQVQYQSLRNKGFQQVSIRSGIWFGIRCSPSPLLETPLDSASENARVLNAVGTARL